MCSTSLHNVWTFMGFVRYALNSGDPRARRGLENGDERAAAMERLLDETAGVLVVIDDERMHASEVRPGIRRHA